jgi:hypothetical protein
MERLVQSNSWPFVEIASSNADPDGTPHIHFDVMNEGVGPARIETLEVAYDGKSMSSPRAMVNALLNRTTDPHHPAILESGIAHSVLAARERRSFVDFLPRNLSAEDYASIDVGRQKLSFLACYCSVFDECWMVDSRKTQPSKVKMCPASSTSF